MTSLEICEAIAARLVLHYPSYPIYRDFCPADFRRPAFFLTQESCTVEDANCYLLSYEADFALELFCARERYDDVSNEALIALQTAVLALFDAPKLAVSRLDSDTRFVSLSCKAEGTAPGSAFLSFRASWLAPRTAQAAEASLMQEYRLQVMQQKG